MLETLSIPLTNSISTISLTLDKNLSISNNATNLLMREEEEMLKEMEKSAAGNKKVAFLDPIECFDDSSSDCFSSDTLSMEEIETLWWQKDELSEIRSNAKLLTKMFRQDNRECYPIMMALKKTKLILNSEIQKLVQLPLSRPDEDLQSWCAKNDGRRGLERYASKEYATCHHNDLYRVRRAVLAQQAIQSEEDIYDAELVAESSRMISRRARTFALFMGEADSYEASASDVQRIINLANGPSSPVGALNDRATQKRCPAA